MINIISKQSTAANIGGPKKVFDNLILGLDKIGYPYCVNRSFNATKRTWIHDNHDALTMLPASGKHVVLGPNLFVHPNEIPAGIHMDSAVYVQPCEWVVRQWKNAGFTRCALRSWPVGIDTDAFTPTSDTSAQKKVLVYHKLRSTRELPTIFEALSRLHLPYELMMYGSYTEEEYKEALSHTSFIVWHGCHESQGIGLQEALSCNIPVLVCDAQTMRQYKGNYKIPEDLLDTPVTSVPYFDERCGIRITDVRTVQTEMESMIDRIKWFEPRNYIMENLTLEKQAHEFVALWEHWGMQEAGGRDEVLMSSINFYLPLLFRARKVMERAIRYLSS